MLHGEPQEDWLAVANIRAGLVDYEAELAAGQEGLAALLVLVSDAGEGRRGDCPPRAGPAICTPPGHRSWSRVATQPNHNVMFCSIVNSITVLLFDLLLLLSIKPSITC